MTVSRCRDVVVACLVAGTIGCLPQLQASPRAQADATHSRCRPPYILPQVAQSYMVKRVGNTADFRAVFPWLSREAHEAAAQAGVLDLLAAWPTAETGRRDEGDVVLASLRQALSRRVAVAASDVMATIAALECEAARSDHVANAIAEAHQDVSERALFAVFASDIFIGILPGALMLAGHDIAAEASEVFGGVAATAFGSVDAVLHIGQDFSHPLNFLRDLVKAPALSKLFPPSVWLYLNGPSEHNPSRTVREELLDRWQSQGRWHGHTLIPNETEEAARLFGDGGRYDERLLRMRAEMLRQLGSEVLSFGLAIHRLKYELTQWLDAQPV
jgi:hypothetical protein